MEQRDINHECENNPPKHLLNLLIDCEGGLLLKDKDVLFGRAVAGKGVFLLHRN